MFFKKNIVVPIEVSARHCHLSEKDFRKLFGFDAKLEKIKQLSQPSDFACNQTVDIEIGSKKIEKVRVVGPLRECTQIEISMTDAVGSGVKPPLRISGDLAGSEKVVLIGPVGKVELNEGLIIAKRHIHCATDEAKKLGLKHGQIVSVQIDGERSLTLHCVEIRVKDNYKLTLHLDTDEGNSCGINKIGQGKIL